MAANVYVRVSGPALSFLLYENVKSCGDQEGFLLGEVLSHVTDTISDSQIRGEKSETLISVNSLMPIPNSLTFYNGIGKINHETLKEFLKEKEKEVVGWYSFRRNSVLSPHLREKLLHKELCSSLSHLSSEHFTMCLLNTSVSTPGSTHVFNHKFIRYRYRIFEPLPVQIHNLGEAPQSEYKLVPSTACLSDSFNDIISSLRAGHEMSSDASLVCKIQRALQEHLRNLINDVERSERRIAELEKEIDTIRLQPGPISNEVLLPQIMKEEVPAATAVNNTNANNKTDSSVDTVNAKVNKTPNNHQNTKSSSNLGASVKEEVPAEEKNSSDAFDFVTEMKIQMSQPLNTTTAPSETPSSNTSSKRPGDRTRGIARGMGRGTRRPAQAKNVTEPEVGSVTRHPQPSQLLDNSATTPPKANSQNMNNLNSKTRTGYAQAVKRSGAASDNVGSKTSTMSQIISANNSPSGSDTQKY
ncbi:hypothetical protein C0J52_18061 [Blattella germanica]|nr:hypothetical protein C0J52_18061 [Blattella germanica]